MNKLGNSYGATKAAMLDCGGKTLRGAGRRASLEEVGILEGGSN